MLPHTCERALLERFLRAEAMALWSVRSAQTQDVPSHVLKFLRQHEDDEQEHLRRFEALVGEQSWKKSAPPRVPTQWSALAVHLYGFEALGLEFAKLLAGLCPDLSSILEDEETHVLFFEREIQKILAGGEVFAQLAQTVACAWWRRLPRTLDRYLGDETLAPYREELRCTILAAIEERLTKLGLIGLGNS